MADRSQSSAETVAVRVGCRTLLKNFLEAALVPAQAGSDCLACLEKPFPVV